MARELKGLKKIQSKNASDLVVKNSEDSYPKRIKKLSEELRVSKE